MGSQKKKARGQSGGVDFEEYQQDPSPLGFKYIGESITASKHAKKENRDDINTEGITYKSSALGQGGTWKKNPHQPKTHWVHQRKGVIRGLDGIFRPIVKKNMT